MHASTYGRGRKPIQTHCGQILGGESINLGSDLRRALLEVWERRRTVMVLLVLVFLG